MVMWVRKAERLARTCGELIARIEKVVRKGSPRLVMAGIVAATTVAGMGASLVLRWGGLSAMWFRYGLSVAFAYFSFMFFLWLWIAVKRRGRYRDPVGDSDDDLANDVMDAVDDLSHVDLSSGGPYDQATSSPEPASGASGGDTIGSSLDLDDAIVGIAVAAAIIAAAAASLYVVAIAPQFLAELLLDGVFATIFFRRVRAADRRHWFESALSRTWVPALCAAVLFMIAGAVCQWYAPEAATLGGVFQHWRAKDHPPQPIDLDSAF